MILIHLIISENHNLQQGLNQITLSLLTRDYPLEMINENIRQAMNNSRDTILHISKSSKTLHRAFMRNLLFFRRSKIFPKN